MGNDFFFIFLLTDFFEIFMIDDSVSKLRFEVIISLIDHNIIMRPYIPLCVIILIMCPRYRDNDLFYIVKFLFS